jgi:hypothetical protein
MIRPGIRNLGSWVGFASPHNTPDRAFPYAMEDGMVRSTLRSLGAALVVVATLASAATAQIGGGTTGGGPKPPPGGTPGGGGHPIPPDAKKHIREIITTGRKSGLSDAQIKAQVNQYLQSIGLPPIP